MQVLGFTYRLFRALGEYIIFSRCVAPGWYAYPFQGACGMITILICVTFLGCQLKAGHFPLFGGFASLNPPCKVTLAALFCIAPCDVS